MKNFSHTSFTFVFIYFLHLTSAQDFDYDQNRNNDFNLNNENENEEKISFEQRNFDNIDGTEDEQTEKPDDDGDYASSDNESEDGVKVKDKIASGTDTRSLSGTVSLFY